MAGGKIPERSLVIASDETGRRQPQPPKTGGNEPSAPEDPKIKSNEHGVQTNKAIESAQAEENWGSKVTAALQKWNTAKGTKVT